MSHGGGGKPLGNTDRHGDQYGQQTAAHDKRHGPFAATGTHVDKWALGGEHHTEDQQHQCAADINHQLHGPDKIGTSQKHEAAGCRQGKNKIHGHAYHVAGEDHGQRHAARQQGEQQEK